MPRKSAKQTAGEAIAVVGILVIAAIVALFKFIEENPWILLFVAAVVLAVIWIRNIQQSKEEEQNQRIQELLAQEQKEREEKRVQGILFHKNEWGDEMCQWLIDNDIDTSNQATLEILNNLQDWGKETCQDLLKRRISIGMTSEMVALAVGDPTSIDDRVVSEKEEKYRWIYGTPRQGATYIWFKNGIVTKIKQ